MKNIIGLCGAAGAGKDTVALMLQGYRAIAFADSLYVEVADAFGVTVEWLKRREFKEVSSGCLRFCHCDDATFIGFMETCYGEMYVSLPRSPRQILQWWGDYRRAQDPDYFVKAARARMVWGEPHVFTDVRFANEAALVRQLGGEIWQVVRPGVAAGGTGHASDVDGSQFAPDAIILNSWGLEDLRASVQTTCMARGLQLPAQGAL